MREELYEGIDLFYRQRDTLAGDRVSASTEKIVV